MIPKFLSYLKKDEYYKKTITFKSWNSIVFTRSDNDNLYIYCFGTNNIKKGTYSIEKDFKIQTFPITKASNINYLTISVSAVSNISVYDWGISLSAKRSEITNINDGDYIGMALVGTDLIIKSN